MDAADLVVINTCAIREAAEAKVIGRQGAPRAAQGREPVDARRDDRLLGPRDRTASGSTRRYPGRGPVPAAGRGAGARRPAGARVRAGAGGRARRRPRRDDARQGRAGLATRRTSCGPAAEAIAGGAVQPRHSAISAWLPIIYGCDKTCTYCIVPFSRGPERSRPFDEIVDEARALAAAGLSARSRSSARTSTRTATTSRRSRDSAHVHTERMVGPAPGPRGPPRPRGADPRDRRAADRRRRARRSRGCGSSPRTRGTSRTG